MNVCVRSNGHASNTQDVEKTSTLRKFNRGLRAHGLCDGDRFALSPSSLTPNLGAEGRFVAEITRARPLTSDLRLLDVPHNLQTGWIAEPLTCSYLTTLCVRLASDLPGRDELLTALKRRSIGNHTSTDQTPALHIKIGLNDEYDILDGSGIKLDNIPTMPRGQTEVVRLCDVTEHLARFKMAKDLVNTRPTASIRESCHVQIIHGQEAFGPGAQIEVRHNGRVQVVMKNTGDADLYAHVYNLGPCWQVKNILRGTYEVILPRKDACIGGGVRSTGVSMKKISMTVPPVMQKHGSCKDIIKVFITSQPTSLDSLELPNLDEMAKKSSGGRISSASAEVEEDWVAFSFYIGTSI